MTASNAHCANPAIFQANAVCCDARPEITSLYVKRTASRSEVFRTGARVLTQTICRAAHAKSRSHDLMWSFLSHLLNCAPGIPISLISPSVHQEISGPAPRGLLFCCAVRRSVAPLSKKAESMGTRSLSETSEKTKFSDRKLNHPARLSSGATPAPRGERAW
jgi:hypothetical protein